jgi:TorA maturation chaperone TorD
VIPESKGTKSAEEIERISLVRGSVYSFLSSVFSNEIDREFLDYVVAAWPTVKLLAESQERFDLVEGSQRLGRFIQNLTACNEDRRQSLITELRLEFTNLFVAVSDNAVHLVESAYLNHNPRYDKPAQDVQAAYQSLGFKKDSEFFEPEDHLVLEFELMARMCDWTAQALRAKDVGNATAYLSLQKEFLRDHIARWIPELCEDLKRKAKSDFYSSLAYLTKGFVQMDCRIPDHLTAMLKSGLSKDDEHLP